MMRVSPVAAALRSLPGTWADRHQMPTLLSTPDDNHKASALGIADVSYLPRLGVKGSGAAEWLASHGISVPDRPNTWSNVQGGLMARLGLTEFLIEADQPVISALETACQSPPPRVYPVLRRDLAIALQGSALPELLRQTCNINFQALSLGECPVVLTSMIGVAVTVIPGERDGLPFYRIWCDGTFGMYFWETLVAIAEELSGGAVGVTSVGFI